MIESFSKGNSKDKKMLAEAQQMLADSKAKIEYLKMRMAKMKQCSRTADGGSNNGEQLHKGTVFLYRHCCVFLVICALVFTQKTQQTLAWRIECRNYATDSESKPQSSKVPKM